METCVITAVHAAAKDRPRNKGLAMSCSSRTSAEEVAKKKGGHAVPDQEIDLTPKAAEKD